MCVIYLLVLKGCEHTLNSTLNKIYTELWPIQLVQVTLGGGFMKSFLNQDKSAACPKAVCLPLVIVITRSLIPSPNSTYFMQLTADHYHFRYFYNSKGVCLLKCLNSDLLTLLSLGFYIPHALWW